MYEVISTSKGQDFNPQYYSNVATNLQVKDALLLLDLHHFEHHHIVLDLGCGDGQISVDIAQRLVPKGRVIGVDPSAAMIEHANRSYHEHANATLITGDARTLYEDLKTANLNDNGVDVIFSNHVLHWIYDDDEHVTAMQHMKKTLSANGGVLLLCLATEGTFKELFESAYLVAKQAPWCQYYAEDDLQPRKFPQLGLYQNTLLGLGFELNVCEKRLSWREFSNAEAFVLWIKTSLRTFMNKLQHLPDEQQRLFAQQVVAQYVETIKFSDDYPHEQGGADEIFLRDSMIFIYAKLR